MTGGAVAGSHSSVAPDVARQRADWMDWLTVETSAQSRTVEVDVGGVARVDALVGEYGHDRGSRVAEALRHAATEGRQGLRRWLCGHRADEDAWRMHRHLALFRGDRTSSARRCAASRSPHAPCCRCSRSPGRFRSRSWAWWRDDRGAGAGHQTGSLMGCRCWASACVGEAATAPEQRRLGNSTGRCLMPDERRGAAAAHLFCTRALLL